MKKLRIVWTSDHYECDICYGGDAEGFIAYLDGEILDEFIPSAYCYDSITINEQDTYKRIFEKLGFNLETESK